jgi:hypothetical protein
MMFLFIGSNPEWLESCVIPVNQLLCPCNEEKGHVILDTRADIRYFLFYLCPQCRASDKLQTFWLGVVETVWAFPSPTHGKESCVVAAARYNDIINHNMVNRLSTESVFKIKA